MTNDRSHVLAQVRQSLKSAVLPSASPFIPPLSAPGANAPGLVEGFTRELNAAGVKVESPATHAQAIEKTIELLETAASRRADSCSVKEILAWDDSEFPIPDLGLAVRAAGFIPLDARIPAGRDQARSRLAELGRASVGLTGALAGLADTGTLVLLSGPARPRLASLLPPVHIVIVSKRAIFPAMAAFFAAHPNDVLQASNLVFITGPSRTADIEQTLTLGVHGPREVYVILVD